MSEEKVFIYRDSESEKLVLQKHRENIAIPLEAGDVYSLGEIDFDELEKVGEFTRKT